SSRARPTATPATTWATPRSTAARTRWRIGGRPIRSRGSAPCLPRVAYWTRRPRGPRRPTSRPRWTGRWPSRARGPSPIPRVSSRTSTPERASGAPRERLMRELTYAQALNEALHEEMERDPHVWVLGEDIAAGRGGIFGVTRGLLDRFGAERVRNTPL